MAYTPATKYPTNAVLTVFQWSRPDAPNPRIAQPVDSTATTITVTNAPLDRDGAVLTSGFLMNAQGSNGAVEIIYVPAGAVSVDGLTFTGVVRGIRPEGLDYTTGDAEFAIDLPQDAPIGCAVAQTYHRMMIAALQGVIASGAPDWRIGNAVDENITVYAFNGDATQPFFRYDSATNQWVYSDDGVSSTPFGTGAGVTGGDGIDVTAGVISVDLDADSQMSVATGELREANLRNYVLAENLTDGDLVKILANGEVSKSIIAETFAVGATTDEGGVTGTVSIPIRDSNKFLLVYADGINIMYIIATVEDLVTTYTTAAQVAAGIFDANVGISALVYDEASDRVVLAYGDATASDGQAVVGEFSDDLTSMTWGTPVQFTAAETDVVSAVYHPIEEKVVVVYQSGNDTGQAVIGTVTAGTNTIVFSSPVQVSNGAGSIIRNAIGYGNGNLLYSYSNSSGGAQFVKVMTLSVTTLTQGTAVQVTASGTNCAVPTYDTVQDAWLFSRGTASYKITISGTVPTISASSANTLNLDTNTQTQVYVPFLQAHALLGRGTVSTDFELKLITVTGATPTVGVANEIGDSNYANTDALAWNANIGRFLTTSNLTIGDGLASNAVRMTADIVDYDSIAGVMQESGSTAESKKVMLIGGIAAGVFTPGATLIASPSATITEGEYEERLIGRAISASAINLTKNP